MGIDYRRMQPNNTVSQSELRQLMERQAVAMAQATHLFIQDLDCEPRQTLNPEASSRFRATSDALEQHLSFDQQPASEAFPDRFRVYTITYNPLFPFEIQRAAYRSFLPADLAQQVHAWKSYLHDLEQGKYGAYLYQRYCYERSVDLWNGWYDVHQTAQTVIQRTNAWTQKPAFKTLCTTTT